MSSFSVEKDSVGDEKSVLINQLVILGEISSTETALFHQVAAESLGFGLSDMKVLSILLREGDKHPGELMTRLRITTGAVTSLIDRLERKGTVTRRIDPTDRRKVIVGANREALGDGFQVYLAMGAAFEELLASYSLPELRLLRRHLDATVALTRQQISLVQLRQ